MGRVRKRGVGPSLQLFLTDKSSLVFPRLSRFVFPKLVGFHLEEANTVFVFPKLHTVTVKSKVQHSPFTCPIDLIGVCTERHPKVSLVISNEVQSVVSLIPPDDCISALDLFDSLLNTKLLKRSEQDCTVTRIITFKFSFNNPMVLKSSVVNANNCIILKRMSCVFADASHSSLSTVTYESLSIGNAFCLNVV